MLLFTTASYDEGKFCILLNGDINLLIIDLKNNTKKIFSLIQVIYLLSRII